MEGFTGAGRNPAGVSQLFGAAAGAACSDLPASVEPAWPTIATPPVEKIRPSATRDGPRKRIFALIGAAHWRLERQPRAA